MKVPGELPVLLFYSHLSLKNRVEDRRDLYENLLRPFKREVVLLKSSDSYDHAFHRSLRSRRLIFPGKGI